MRIIRFEDPTGQVRLGQQLPELAADKAELLTGDLFGKLLPTGQILQVQRLLAPLVPSNLFCIGLNYREHAKESNSPLPPHPVIFMKPTTAVTDPGAPIRIPRCCQHGPEVDYECELAVVLGQTCRDVPVDRALDYVLGYTCANDVSARRWQRHGGGGQWVRGKSFDTFCPLGPALVTRDQLPDPQTMRIKTILNGQVMQDHTTADMIFTVAQIISFISQDTTLLPGTVILTGTPQGVGFARKPPVFFKAGDRVAVEIENIGRLENPVEA